MHDLIQLQETVPMAKHEKKLQELSRKILKEIGYGNSNFRMRLSFKFNSQELRALSDANIVVTVSETGEDNINYHFSIN
ncbi:hypothetical protein [Companilactobacillus nodensis]|uniref:Uncharacterized protein n=1 Tax=Companilactobacillus nodensis DSM 19682 = JCM 14932 = NBRC 107160 TaxID=1423775 RepID=A0A0R1K674_9LACO|nr:hypothetical protein [Companilactobacillus nodensis]KRK78779.1 hypothetical protein FD03_GL002559 [Companilactobacillus nodensis DSM 19682 = JCM 14932 = NBRC 107160]